MNEKEQKKHTINLIKQKLKMLNDVSESMKREQKVLEDWLAELTKLPVQPTLESLEVGQTIYVVTANGNDPWMETWTVMSLPRKIEHGGDSLFISVKLDGYIRNSEKSLKDANIIPNHYNNEKSFYDRDIAERYLAYCRDNMIPSCKNRSISF